MPSEPFQVQHEGDFDLPNVHQILQSYGIDLALDYWVKVSLALIAPVLSPVL